MAEGMMYLEDDPGRSATSDLEEIIQRVTDDVIISYQQKRDRRSTMVFRIIQGGNVQLVTDIIQVLTALKHDDVKRWILGESRTTLTKVGQVKQENTACQRFCRTILRCIILLMTMLCVIITTPIFYVLHGFTLGLFKATRKNITHAIDLPLAFAVFSGNAEMIDLFYQHGITVYQTDEQGNNIFHYLADLSIYDKNRAIKCYELILGKFPSRDIKPALLAQTNAMGYSPVEMLASQGSLQLLSRVAETEGVIRHTIICVTNNYARLRADQILQNEDDAIKRPENPHSQRKAPPENQPGHRVYHYDVSEYEQKDILRKQSLILNLLTDRDISEMEEEDVVLFHRPWIKVWSQSKMKASFLVYSLCKFCAIACFCIFLYYLFLDDGHYQTIRLNSKYRQNYASVVADKMLAPKAMLNDSLKALYTQYAYDELKHSGFLTDSEFILQYCMANVTKLGNVWLNECGKKAFETLELGCDGIDRERLLQDLGFHKDEETRRLFAVLSFTVLVFCICQLAVDLLYRLFFLFFNFPITQGSLHQGIMVFFTKKIPGSYIDLQLMTSFSLLYVFFYLIEADFLSSDLLDVGITREDLLAHLMIFCMLLAFLNIIHILRLIPIVDLFVMTTIKLVLNLLEFLLVFFIIAVAFACIFQFLLRDPACPSKTIDGFGNFSTSFYETFLTVLGEGSIPSNFSLPVKIAYGLYGVISIVMLLNLIIAVMAHTASRVMSNPWKDGLRSMDRLGEVLYAEALIHSVFLPLKLCFKVRPQGLVHIDMDGQNKVFIEVES